MTHSVWHGLPSMLRLLLCDAFSVTPCLLFLMTPCLFFRLWKEGEVTAAGLGACTPGRMEDDRERRTRCGAKAHTEDRRGERGHVCCSLQCLFPLSHTVAHTHECDRRRWALQRHSSTRRWCSTIERTLPQRPVPSALPAASAHLTAFCTSPSPSSSLGLPPL